MRLLRDRGGINMARPQKQGLDYFPHDTDASNDEKLEAMELKHGLTGYALYFKLLERIYRQANLELDVSDAETLQILSRKWHISTKNLTGMIGTAVRLGLFDKDAYLSAKILRSSAICRRASGILEKRNSMKQRYLDLKEHVSDAETIPETGVSAEFLSDKDKDKDKVKDKEEIKETITKETIQKKEYVLPDWIKQETWDAFLEMRKRIKKPLTDYGCQVAIKKLRKLKDEGQNPNEILDASIMNSWQGIYPERGNGNNGKTGQLNEKPGSGFRDSINRPINT
jgi:hypothetical protein